MYQKCKTPNLPADYYVSFEGRKITSTTLDFAAAEFMLQVCEDHQVTEYSTFNDLLRINREGLPLPH